MGARNQLHGTHAAGATAGVWTLEEAREHLSELVRLAEAGLPQHIALRGQPALVMISAAEYARLDPEAAASVMLPSPGERFARLEDFDPAEVRELSPRRDIASFDP